MRWRWALVLFMLAVLLGFTSLVTFYTDWLWFREVGFVAVFWRSIGYRLVVGSAYALFTWLFLAVNVYVARRLSPNLYYLSRSFDLQRLLQQIRPAFDRYFGPIFYGGIALIGALVGIAQSQRWETWLRYFHQQPSQLTDPVFHRSLSFYFFSLPVLEQLQAFLLFLLVTALVLATVIHVLNGSIIIDARRRLAAPHVKVHLSVLAFLAMLILAAGWQIGAYGLLFSPRGAVFGAGYADVHAQLPALRLMIGLTVAAGLAFLLNIYFRGWRLPVVSLAVVAGAWLLAVNVYPQIVHQYRVSPNEIELEKPFIKQDIRLTREAYGLAKIKPRPFPADNRLEPAMLEANRPTLNNVRLWDWRPLQRTYSQIQEIRLYYSFKDVDLDRYMINGEYRQVALAARELSPGKLRESAQTWVNQHLVYTHGYGLVMSPVTEFTSEGLPELLIKNIPPVSTALKIERPEIYFGEETGDYVIVRARTKEFDFPKGERNQYTVYRGRAGVDLSSYWRKLAFSARFSSLKLMLSNAIRPNSRLIFRRNIMERVQAIAPFFTYDPDPYLVVADGRLYWIIDGYTTSERFPYSKPFDGRTNYIRNSVKTVVDAYNGTVRFYLADPKDPIARTYGAAYPGLLRPLESMPAALRAHLRYPEALFRIQAQMYSVYHMGDPQVFYNDEDLWDVANEQYDDRQVPVDPYYTIMQIPGETRPEFVLIEPFTPRNKNNMVAWMAARSDSPNYGELLVYTFPKQKLIYGPLQIEARIDQDPEISRQLSLWNQRGSRVIRGNLMVIPIGQSILYVEPLYLEAEQSQLPELKRVVVGFGDRIAMEPTMAQALAQVFGQPLAPAVQPVAAGPAPEPATATLKELAQQASSRLKHAQAGARAGNRADNREHPKNREETLKKLANQ